MDGASWFSIGVLVGSVVSMASLLITRHFLNKQPKGYR